MAEKCDVAILGASGLVGETMVELLHERALLAQGLRTPDIAAPRGKTVGTEEMGQAVAQALSAGDGDG